MSRTSRINSLTWALWVFFRRRVKFKMRGSDSGLSWIKKLFDKNKYTVEVQILCQLT